MKILPLVFVAAFAMAASVRAQEATTTDSSDPGITTVGTEAPVSSEVHFAQVAPDASTHILGGLPDGTPPPPVPVRVPPPAQVKSSVTRLVDVVEPPPMVGLPQVEGTIKQTVQLVEDPGLPDPPPPPPATPLTDAAMQARVAEIMEAHQRVQMVSVSAIVYDHSRSFLRWRINGEYKKEVSGWSNLDFNQFCGVGDYQAKGLDGVVRQYSLFMVAENTNTIQRAEMLADRGKTYTPPVMPTLPDLATGGPAFVITAGDTTDKDAMDLIQGLHDLYRAEGTRMAVAYNARIKANEERKAYLLANPPKPEDVTVRFWDRAHPARPTTPAAAAVGGDQ